MFRNDQGLGCEANFKVHFLHWNSSYFMKTLVVELEERVPQDG